MTAPLVRDHHAADDHHDASAESARRRLGAAQLDLLPAMPPCAAEPAKWYDPVRMAAAAIECAGCPLTAECGACGAFEKWGIWGGVNRDTTWRARRSHGASGFRAQSTAARSSGTRRRRYGTPMPVPCDLCGARPGAVCRTADGREAEDAHECRKRAVRVAAA